MEWNWDVIVRVLVALVPIITAVVGLASRPDASRQHLKETAESVQYLPDGRAKDAVLDLIASDARALAGSSRLRRDPFGLGLALAGSIGLGYLTLWLVQDGSWWRVALGVAVGAVALIFFAGIFESAQKRDRDAEKEAKESAKRMKASG